MSSEEVNAVSIIGSGTMGTGIAQTFASAGIAVMMIDIDQARLDISVSSIKGNLALFQEFNLISDTPEKILSRIGTTTATDILSATREYDFVIETVPEVVDIKKPVFAQLDQLPERTIIASNTSSFPMDTLTENLKTAHRMVGLHYFNPAHIIPAVEIHMGKQTTDAVVQKTRNLMVKTGKKTGNRPKNRSRFHYQPPDRRHGA